MKNQICRLTPAGIIVLLLLCRFIAHAQQEAHIQLSSKGQSNNLDSLIRDFNRKNIGQNKFGKTGFDPKKIGELKPLSSGLPASGKYATQVQKHNSYRQKFSSLAGNDPIGKINDFHLDSNTVFNNKYMKKYYDSVKKAMPAMPEGFSQSVTQEQLVSEVNKKFREETKVDSLSKVRDDAENKKNNSLQKIDLAKAKINNTEAADLIPIAGSLVQSKYLDKLDSIRRLDLKTKGLQLSEEEIAKRNKLAALKKKERIWDKSYFEGVVSFIQGDDAQFQMSPALAYHLNSWLSIGGGPNLLIKKDLQRIAFTGGVRAFTKAEFLKRKLYAQVEDQMNPRTISTEGDLFSQHNLYAGGGYVLPFFSPFTLNLSLMYKFYSNGDALNTSSPWMIRIGISTHNKNNK